MGRNFMKLSKRGIAALAAAAAVIGGGGAAFAATSQVAAPLVTAVTHVYNDPDSGNGGTWATDAFDRTLTVTADANQFGVPAGSVRYDATVSDSGTFVTIPGAKTPNQSAPGQKVSHTVAGTFAGTSLYVVTAPAADHVGSTLQADLNANHAALTGKYATSQWPDQAFTPDTGVSVAQGNWSWTYSTKFGESWTDSSVNGDGNVVSDGNITGLVVKPAKVPVLSHGQATATAPTRETVSYQQSGAASWDKFYIVGPGAINGHQGWVNGKLGLNFGYYSGLLAKHGYTVYYTPVEGQGSNVQIPGTRTGLVYFVS